MLVVSIAATISASLQQGIHHAVQRLNKRCTVPSRTANITLGHDEDYFDAHWHFIGEYRLSDAEIVLNTGREPEELLIAIFWHEYAHHVYYTLSLQDSEIVSILIDEVRKTNSFSTAEQYDKEELSQYWTSREEVWARLIGQYLTFLSEEKTDYDDMITALEEAGMQQWSSIELISIQPLLEDILSAIGFVFTPAHEW